MAVKTKVEKPAKTLKSTTTQQTTSIDDPALNLRLLRAILDVPTNSATIVSQAKRPKTPLAVAPPQSLKATKSARTLGKDGRHSKVEQKNESLPKPPPSVPEQRKLAMNCFNQSLKVLSAVVRRRQENRLRKSTEEAAKDTESTKRANQEAGDDLNEEQHNIATNAECACAALSVLRLHDQDEVCFGEASYKREQGAVMLLDRMITLGLRDLAYIETSRILEQSWKRRKVGSRAPAVPRPSEKINLAVLVSEHREVTDKKDFDMLTSCQSQVLRLAILLGPSAVNEDFVRSVKIGTKMSPASVVIAGQNNDYTTAKTAGENLRTIAQALSKISSATLKAAQTESIEQQLVALDLLMEAQMIKFISWQLLDYVPNMGPDFWTPVERALRGVWSKHPQKDAQRYQYTTASIGRLRVELQNLSLSPELPTSLDLLLCQLAEINEDGVSAIQSLERLSSAATGPEKLSYACRMATAALQAGSSHEAPAELIEQAAMLLTDAPRNQNSLTADDLMVVVKLRKACFEKLTSSTTTEPEGVVQTTQVAYLRVMFLILQFCHHFWQGKALNEKLLRSLRLASLKGIENILDAESFATSSALPILPEYLHNLEGCVEIISEDSNTSGHTMQSETEPSILHSLKIRISNVFWRSHLHSSITQATDVTSMELARISVACLDGLATEELSKAALGPRLEKLCAMCMQDGEVAAAHSHVRRAIKHYILAGALSDAVEASLSKRSDDVWIDTASLASQLGRVVHTHNSIFISADDEALLEDWIYRDELLPSIHQAVLLEHQISYVLRKRADSMTFPSLDGLVKEVVALTCEGQYQIWSARFISSIIFRASRIPHLSMNSNKAFLETATSILNAISADESASLRPYSTVLFLKPYAAVLQVQLKLQCALIGDIEPKKQTELRQDLAQLLKTIESCSESKSHETIIDNFECFRSVLEAYTDQVSTLCDYESAMLCLKMRIYIEEHCIRSGGTVVGKCYTQLALCQVRVHDTKSARTSLDRTETALKNDDHDLRQALQFQLASAEYYLAISDLTKSTSSLGEAGSVLIRLWPKETSIRGKEQIERDNIIARGSLLASMLALRRGDSLLANQYARQATKISVSIWAALEKRLSSLSITDANTSITSLTEDMSRLNVKSDKIFDLSPIAGPKYWPHLDMHVRSVKHLASILSHSGLFEDALHYLEQLKHLASSMPLSGLFLNPAPASSLLFAKAGRNGEATGMINASVLQLGEQTLRLGFADSVLTCCEACVAQGDLELARSLLSKVSMAPPTDSAMVSKPNVEPVVVDSKVKARRGIGRAETIKAPPKRQNGAVKAASKKVQPEPNQPREVGQLTHSQWVEESRYKAIMLAFQNGPATRAGMNSTPSKNLPQFVVFQTTAFELYEEARYMLSSAWGILSADAFASVLTESAMALPARIRHTQRGGRVSFVQAGANNIGTKALQKSPSCSDARSSCIAETAQTLESALNICNLLLRERQQECSTDLMHSLLKMEARISLLLTSMSLPFVMSSTDLVLRASQPKDCALERERIVSLAEQATQDRTALSIWPSTTSGRPTPAPLLTKKQLDDLPATWSVLSLTLAEGNDELLLSKTIAGRDPFLVRIPLLRSTDDDGADEFTYSDAEDEMKEIIEAANSSSHDSRGSLDKATRSQWHADREVLDQKLGSLLENIETIWLGGFRGVLSPHAFEAEHIKEFGKCLNKSLNKHLPSRQKSSVVEERVDIHDHILETFLGLGDPAENDLDDSIVDLLYFVVDILQFNGERNAYDEIDWDVILIDVLDALKSHYSTVASKTPRHTILILDKELELFPWEALPCLINHPVSRMPSLGSVFDRVTQIRAQSSSKNPSAYTIDKSSARGAYILNPSGDLKSTQESLSPILSDNLATTNYRSLIETPPTESQFSSLLTQSDILLYIGHGSGAQYIRPRTIRALPSCAVTFLFGCSSARMTTHGKFESTGMPRAYMLGHTPAMVGCLWDVTDREIDRVAVQAFVSWGLVDGDDKKVQEILKRRGRKAKAKGKEEERVRSVKGKTLIEAVKDGREACVLRYLCGAAVVVYGVPVVLE